MISIEWRTSAIGCARHHPQGTFGDPYDFVCGVDLSKTPPELYGACGEVPLSPAIWRELLAALRQEGIPRVQFDRRNRGAARNHSVTTKENTMSKRVAVEVSVKAVNLDDAADTVEGSAKYGSMSFEAFQAVEDAVLEALKALRQK